MFLMLQIYAGLRVSTFENLIASTLPSLSIAAALIPSSEKAILELPGIRSVSSFKISPSASDGFAPESTAPHLISVRYDAINPTATPFALHRTGKESGASAVRYRTPHGAAPARVRSHYCHQLLPITDPSLVTDWQT